MGCGDEVAERYSDTNQLLGRLIERTEYLIGDIKVLKGELAADAIRTEARLITLELKSAEYRGGNKMLMTLATVAATVGGFIGHFIGKIWPS
jgi:hypothetical protein